MSKVFTWDSAKAASNIKKHRISFREAVTVFSDPFARIHDDPDHSQAEDREVIVGHSSELRILVVSFLERGNIVRVISARRATHHERKDFEEALLS